MGIRSLNLEGAAKAAIKCLKDVFTGFCIEAGENKDDVRLVNELIPKILELKLEDVSKKAYDTLVVLYGSMIDAAENKVDAKTIEEVLIPKILVQDEEKFGFLAEKATFALERLYKGFVLDAEGKRDCKKIEKKLMPKIKELNLDILEDVQIALAKIYSLNLDDLIGKTPPDEKKIKKTLIPKVKKIGFERRTSAC